MTKYLMLFISLISINSFGQVIDFIDTSDFYIIHLNDTIDIDYHSQTPYPSSIGLDLNCNNENDIIINCYTTPIQNLPSAHNIEIVNLLGDKLEFAKKNNSLAAFRTGEIVDLASIERWDWGNTHRLLYFNVIGGASWAGINSSDSLYVNDMNLIFRFTYNNMYKYGWINYSGKSWPANLFIHKIAIDKSLCSSNLTSEIFNSNFKLFPNPFNNHLNIISNHSSQKSATWKIFAMDGSYICGGNVDLNTFGILFKDKIDKPGAYIIQFFIENKLINSQIITKM